MEIRLGSISDGFRDLFEKKMSKGVLLEFGSKENSDDKRKTHSYLLSFVQQYAEKCHIV